MREMQPGDCFRSGKEERGESRLFKCLSFDTFQFAWGLRARSFLRESLFHSPTLILMAWAQLPGVVILIGAGLIMSYLEDA